ncbi:hypothetical protein H4Q26_008886 [Puccinia striiformis f. sp. tritici PST-130]|nr:hypothetical protein H4Q26_008886 [Puccinia striiformis f. sp. tritici PST-130]
MSKDVVHGEFHCVAFEAVWLFNASRDVTGTGKVAEHAEFSTGYKYAAKISGGDGGVKLDWIDNSGLIRSVPDPVPDIFLSMRTRVQSIGSLMKRTITTNNNNSSNKRPWRMTKNYQQIILNQSEAKLCKLLDRCTDHLSSSSSSSADSLTLRIAGGWVRDKLLGVESNDLDIAISSLTGQDFATKFSNYLIENRQEEEVLELGKIATIEARPDQSKHLETATTTFMGLDLDFVQLRSEEYGDIDSRIPSTVSFGTPLEDALRRDITINSLFYNIHTQQIEDHTEKGLKDLEAGLIRTPLPAEHTFKDDPLRLLRCIRFATRFGFQLDTDIISAAKSESIRVALKEKISRERVGTEVDKMLKGRDPLSSIKMIKQLGLYELVFSPPINLQLQQDREGMIRIEESIAVETSTWLDRLLGSTTDHSTPSLLPNPISEYILSKNESLLDINRRRLFLASALTPYRYFNSKSGKKLVWAGELVIADSLKLGNHDKNYVSHLFSALSILNSDHLKSILNGDSPSILRVELGRILRSIHVHDLKQTENSASLNWQTSFFFALVIEITNLGSSDHSILDTESSDQRNRIIEVYSQVVQKIIELDLPFVVTAEFEKRRLDVLGIKPGRHLAEIIEKLIDRQIQFPNQSKEEGSKWLRDQVQSGLIKIS